VKATLHTDGGAYRSLGLAGIGVVLKHRAGEIVCEIARNIGRGIPGDSGWVTHNTAEYEALIAGLEFALEHGVTDLEIIIDSPVVYGHLCRGYKHKAEHLKLLADRVRSLLERFDSAPIERVPSKQNREAHVLATQGMKSPRTQVHRCQYL